MVGVFWNCVFLKVVGREEAEERNMIKQLSLKKYNEKTSLS